MVNFISNIKRNTVGANSLSTTAIMIKEGVFRGEFITFDAIASTHKLWIDKPVVIPNHPTDKPNSEWSQEIVTNHLVGYIKSVTLDNVKRALKANLMLNISKMYGLGYEQTLDDIRSGKRINGSIGFWFNHYTYKDGFYQGEPYNLIINKITTPDHYAILPDINGVCSIGGGCGVNLI